MRLARRAGGWASSRLRQTLSTRLMLLALVAAVACAPETTHVPATQLIVRVSTDLALREALGSLRIRTAAPSNGRWAQQVERTYAVSALSWPVDLVLLPRSESSADDTFEVIVEALDAQADVLAQARVLTSYVLREARVLRLALASCGASSSAVCETNPECYGPGCRTCLMSGCAATPVVQTADLPISELDDEADAAVSPVAALPNEAGSQPSAGTEAGAASCESGVCSDPCAGACDPMASCSVASGKAICSCPPSYATSDAGKTCVRDADAGRDAAIDVDAGTPVTSTKLPRVASTDGPGPFSGISKVKGTGPGGWLVYPSEIGKGGVKHPLFLFAPNGATTPAYYEDLLDRWASYGFVIYATPRSSGTGAEMKAGLDWLIEQNSVSSGPLYQKLDVAKVCAAGHSAGSLSTFAFMPDPRVTTTIHISGGSMDALGPSKLRSATLFLCGPSSAEDVAAPNCDRDFLNSSVPTFYSKIQTATHLNSTQMGSSAISAWLLWHLADQEDQWKKEFLQTGGKFQSGMFVSQSKNWP